MTDALNFPFYLVVINLNLTSHMWPVATIMANRVLEICAD